MRPAAGGESAADERPLRIGVVTNYLPADVAGGAQLQAVRMAQELARTHSVTLFARGRPGAEDALARPRLSVVLRWPLEIRALRLLDDTRLALRQIRRRRASLDLLVCYQSLAPGFIGAQARRKLGLPYFVWVRGRHEYRMDRVSRFRALVPHVFRSADRVLVQAQSVADEVLEAFDRFSLRRTREEVAARIAVVPNGVDLRSPRSAGGEGLVYVGRLIREKGLEELLEALERLGSDQRLTIVGDGPERARLEEASRGLSVTFTGHLSHAEAVEQIAASSCLVLPSHSEAFPNVILEAMTLGVPVVATATGGTVDLVRDGETGLLVPPKDAKRLAAALERVRDDHDLRRSLGEQAREASKGYSWPLATERLVREIRRVLIETRAVRP